MNSATLQGATFSFVCPHCQHHTDVDLKYAGEHGLCVSCGKPISLPDALTLELTTKRHVGPPPKPVWVRWGLSLGVLLSLGLIGTMVYLLLQPTLASISEASDLNQCQAQLKVIGEALESYRAVHGEYPPSVVYDEQGKPLHSWRALILPYLDPKLAGLYDLNEPWNGPKNSRLATEIPSVFRCSADKGLNAGETNYLAVIGTNTLIRDTALTQGKPTKSGELKDYESQTLVVIESENSAVPWFAPKDISIDELRAGLGSLNPSSPGSLHPHGINALMADGSVVCLPNTTSSADLRAMATIDGNEFIETLDDLGK